MQPDVIHAVHIAEKAHHGQARKYNGAPYITHPLRVMVRYMRMPIAFDYGACAAVLHDVLEDCPEWPRSRLAEAGVPNITLDVVVALTNPSKQFPALPRAERKAMDRHHIARAPHTARCIKLIDRADNLGELDFQKAPDFARLYAQESDMLAYTLKGTDAQLEAELREKIDYVMSQTPPTDGLKARGS